MFITYLKARFHCVVISQAELQEMTRQSVNVYDQLIDADIIIIIHSEAAYKLYNVFKTECICNFSRTFGPINDSFILCLSKLLNEQRAYFINNTFAVQFDCTPSEFVISHSRIKLYKFVEDIKKFEQRLQRKLSQTHQKSLSDNPSIKELTQQTEACKTFQFSHPYWFSELYCQVTKSSISSDDSGVDIHKDLIHNSSLRTECHSSIRQLRHNRLNRHRRRSLSLDTLSGQFCRSASMHRDNSFSFSDIERRFIRPEFGDENEDTPTVLLTEQMREINERYDYIVDQDLELTDESFEKLGTSV